MVTPSFLKMFENYNILYISFIHLSRIPTPFTLPIITIDLIWVKKWMFAIESLKWVKYLIPYLILSLPSHSPSASKWVCQSSLHPLFAELLTHHSIRSPLTMTFVSIRSLTLLSLSSFSFVHQQPPSRSLLHLSLCLHHAPTHSHHKSNLQ